MPFDDRRNSYFKGIIAPACESAGAHAIKADQIYGTGAIIQDIWRSIWSAQIVIADVTGRNPNVNYELGLCHALGVPTILISENIDDVPFDYRHRRCILYDVRSVDWQRKLENDIKETIKAVLAGSGGEEELEWPYETQDLKHSADSGPLIPSEIAREPVLRGINQVEEAIAMALGPHGSTVLTSSRTFGARQSRNGTAIAAAYSSANSLVQLGVDQVRELTREISGQLGDGSKSGALLFCEMVKGGYEALKSGALLRDLTSEMDLAVESAVSHLTQISLPADEHNIEAVALSAALGERLDAHAAISAIRNAGPDGVVYIEDSPNANTDLRVEGGMHFNRGFISDRFMTDEPRQLAAMSDAYILLCDFRLNSMQYLLPILEQVARAGRSLLVVAEDVEGEALATLEINLKRGAISCVPVKSPGSGPTRTVILEDIAVACGGAVISHPQALSTTRLSQLGSAEGVEVTRSNTWLANPRGDPASIERRASGIRQQISTAAAEFDSERLRERLASLVGATVAIRVGGVSESDRAERKSRITAALHSARAASSKGLVFGGGHCLWEASKTIKRDPKMISTGSRIVADALVAPLIAQINNARVSVPEVLRQLEGMDDSEAGFDAAKREIVNLKDAKLFDAARIVIRALQIAFVHARNVLQTGAWEIPGTPSNG